MLVRLQLACRGCVDPLLRITLTQCTQTLGDFTRRPRSSTGCFIIGTTFSATGRFFTASHESDKHTSTDYCESPRLMKVRLARFLVMRLPQWRTLKYSTSSLVSSTHALQARSYCQPWGCFATLPHRLLHRAASTSSGVLACAVMPCLLSMERLVALAKSCGISLLKTTPQL